MHSNTIATREWLSYGSLWTGGTTSGLPTLLSNNGLGDKFWQFATLLFI
ncbi:MAG: hypothetical protein IJ193_08090 [Bacilli bacterium]|nr:hypothetical protein [Bacilli bacterium]